MHRPRIVLSAYACRPGFGSEHLTGWQTAVHLAPHCALTVLTRLKNQSFIEEALTTQPIDVPIEFLYYDLPKTFVDLKERGVISTRVYYLLWQRLAFKSLRRELLERNFEIAQHLTFNSFESASVLWKYAKHCIVGPIGGGMRVGDEILPLFHGRAILERLRNFRVGLSARNPLVRRTLARADYVFFANQETADLVGPMRTGPSEIMLDVGVDPRRFDQRSREKSAGGLRVLFAGRLEARKGIWLIPPLLERVVDRVPELSMVILGTGPEEAALRKRLAEFIANGRVSMRGEVSHNAMLSAYRNTDCLLFPSLRDTSGTVVLEAMACGLPVLAIKHQGARLMLRPECSILVEPGPVDLIVDALACALATLHDDRELVLELGEAGRQRATQHFSWEARTERFLLCYRRLLAER